jgi:hypothetical protein
VGVGHALAIGVKEALAGLFYHFGDLFWVANAKT